MKYHKNSQLEAILKTPKCLINKPQGTDNILRQVCKNITPAKTIMQEKGFYLRTWKNPRKHKCVFTQVLKELM